QKMKEKGWEFDISSHQITIPTDINADPYQVDAIAINTENSRDFAITMEEFRQFFDRFCYDSVLLLNKEKSWRKMRETLINFAEYYLAAFEFDARKIYLYPQNKALILDDIRIALEKFSDEMDRREIVNRRVEYEEWIITKERGYSEHHLAEGLEGHALTTFYEQVAVSNPEVLFKEYLI